MILHSKITPKRPKITPDHTKSSQKHAFGTYFLNRPRQTIFIHCPTPSEGNSLYFKWPFGRRFRFKSEKKTYQWTQLGNIDPKILSKYGVNYEPIWEI